jgi:hypothetical protein
MTVSRRDFLCLSGQLSGLTAGGAISFQWSGERLIQAARSSGRVAASENVNFTTTFADDLSQIHHVLNRLTWGVRPEDLQNINEMGIEGYIDWQLQPEIIADPKVEEFVAGRRILNMSWQELALIASQQYDRILETMIWGRIFRATYSEHQLYELMVEFWTDHFNIPIADLLADKTIDDREVVRAHALGHFRDLLFASARSPAMLQYLNNDSSNAEYPNENYAREIMELHTLGVDGGYTETDVREVARALTGWTVRNGAFFFDRGMHDEGQKTVLGIDLTAGRGIEDGLQVLDILATHPSNARFISMKLIRRFVSDQPPQTLIESTAAVFSSTEGDLRAVMRHILTSNEFMASAGQKFRRPLDYLVAMMRVMNPGLQIENPLPLVYTLEGLGQMPFYWHPPNGYPDAAGAWINTGGLLNRWNLALNLTLAGEGYFDGTALNIEAIVPMTYVTTVRELVDAASDRVLGGKVNDIDRDNLIAFVGESGDQALTPDLYYTKLPGLLGLLFSSPYFQWH